MWLAIVLFLLFLLIVLPFIYLLFAPFFIEIDSRKGIYRLRFHRLLSAAVVMKNGSMHAGIKIMWWQKEYDLLASSKKKAGIEKPKPASKRESKRKFGIKWQQIQAVIWSFKVNKCNITIDTGDMPMNGMLYPFFYLLSVQWGKTVMINFWGENEVTLEIENRIARMIWAFMKAL